MRNRVSWTYIFIVVGIPLILASTATAQTDFDTQWAVGEGLWSEDANWVFLDGSEAEAPSIGFDESAWIGNGGTAIVDSSVPDIVKLQVPNGTVLIQQGGSLKAVNSENPDAMGPSDIGRNGTLSLSGNGSLSAVDLKNNGVIELNSLGANLNVTGDLNHKGTLALNITSAGTSKVTVGGAATLAGTIAANFDNSVNPVYGDSFEFLSGASSVTNNVPSVVIPDSLVLDVGLDIQVTNTNNTASLVVSNLPVLQVDRVTGAANLTNVVGGDVTFTGYNISSASGLLNPQGFTGTGAAGFVRPNPTNNAIAEISLEGTQTLKVNDLVSIGNAYIAGPTHPNDEDVVFEFSTVDGRIIQGLVDYTGPANDVVLNANPNTGEVTIYHLSSHLAPVDITGYLLTSDSGSLNADNWTSFVDTGSAGEGWTEANPSAAHISELNLESSMSFANGTVISLGTIFSTAGQSDLKLQYTTADAIFDATVTYGEVPSGGPAPGIPGDIDGNGTVGFPDFLILSANFGTTADPVGCCGDINGNGSVDFPDFLVLSANFGQSAGAAAAAVPEPNSAALLGLGGALLCGLRRRRRNNDQALAPSPASTERCPRRNWMLLVLTALVVLIATATPARADLIGYWPFEDGEGMIAKDLSGNENHGELTDTAEFTADGKFGGALNLGDLGNGAAVLLNDAALGENGAAGFNSIIESQNVTISFWMNRGGADPTNQWTFLFQNEAGQRQLGSHAPWSDGNVYWDVASDADGCCNADNRISEPLGSAATDGEWHHLAFRKLRPAGEDLGQTSIWVDGMNIKESDGFIIADISELTGASIGANNGGNDSQNGFIDEFAIWDEALSDDVIKALSEGGQVLPLREPLGDFNADGNVDVADFAILAANMGDKFSRDDAVNRGDFNGDLRVNLKDFLGFRQVFNASQGATAAVPEPVAGLLGLCGAVSALHFARRRSRRVSDLA